MRYVYINILICIVLNLKSQVRYNKNLLIGILAQFFYVGGQVCVSSFFIRYCEFAAGVNEAEATNYLGFLLLGFMLGRYVGTFVMQYVKPAILLSLYSISA